MPSFISSYKTLVILFFLNVQEIKRSGLVLAERIAAMFFDLISAV